MNILYDIEDIQYNNHITLLLARMQYAYHKSCVEVESLYCIKNCP